MLAIYFKLSIIHETLNSY